MALSKNISKVVLATNNKNKVKEIKKILRKAGLKIKILTLDAFPSFPPVIENKPTIEGNAIKKAQEVAKKTGVIALSDDTGLFIDALSGRPGVYSARFAGPGCTFMDNNEKVLRLMKKIPWAKRNATFRCVAAVATPEGQSWFIEGKIKGKISLTPIGKNGFGYDPIFMVPSLKKTFAQIGPSVKNKISHRALAFSKLPALLRKVK